MNASTWLDLAVTISVAFGFELPRFPVVVEAYQRFAVRHEIQGADYGDPGYARPFHRVLFLEPPMPRIDEVRRFAFDRKACDAECDANYAAEKRFRELQELNPAQYAEYTGAIEEVCRRWYLYNDLRHALDPYASQWFRRKSLQSLRESLGESAFYDGAMPPSVPVEFYRRVWP